MACADALKCLPWATFPRQSPFVTHGYQTARDPIAASFPAMAVLLDGQDFYLALTLPAVLDKVTDAKLGSCAASAFPVADQLIVLAVRPDAAALPGACVISSPAKAANCR